MDPVQFLNERLKACGRPPAEFTYVETEAGFQASVRTTSFITYLPLECAGIIRDTKESAMEDCALDCLEIIFTAPNKTMLIVDHTDETFDQILELSKPHVYAILFTNDSSIQYKGHHIELEYDIPGVSRATLMVSHIIPSYDDDCAVFDIVIKTKNPEVIAFVNAMKSRKIHYYEEPWKTITIV